MLDKSRNYMIKNVELNWAKLNKPVNPFGTEQWELQIATKDKKVAKELSQNHLNVKEKDGIYTVSLKRKAIKSDGATNQPPRVVDGNRKELNMEDDFRYINKDGYTVLKSSFHRNRGRCCKASCLHCPFGHTLKTFPVEIVEINESNLLEGNSIFDFFYNQDSFTSSLNGDAFGKNETIKFDIKSFYI